MKETFKSFVELLISVALDEDVMTALERENGEQIHFHLTVILSWIGFILVNEMQ